MTNVSFVSRRQARDNAGMTIRSAAIAVVVAVAWPLSSCSPSNTDAVSTSTTNGAETTPQQQTSVPKCGPPALRVLSPQDGASVTAPFPVTYEITCFSVDRDGTIYFTADGMKFDLRPHKAAGTVTVPDHPMLSGRRTVTIQLADTKGQALGNPEAKTVMTVTIAGSRGAT